MSGAGLTAAPGGVAPSSQLLPAWPLRGRASAVGKRARASRLWSVCGWRVLGGPGARVLPAAPGVTDIPGLPGATGSLLLPVRPAWDPLFWGVDHWGCVESGRALRGSWSPLCSFSQGIKHRSVLKVKQDPRELGHWVPLPTQWA